MKILFVTNYFHPVKGGVENHVYNLSKELIKIGHEVDVWCSDSSRSGSINKNEEIYEKIRIRRFPTLFRIGDFGVVFPGVFNELRNNNFDVIHVHVYRHLHNFIPLFTKTRCILTPHWPDYPKELRSSVTNFLIRTFDVFLGRFILDKYKRIVCVTGLEKEWFIQKFKIKKDKLDVLPNGIPKGSLSNKKEIKSEVKNILCFSRHHKSKGLDQVIKLARSFPNLSFSIAGEKGEDTNRLEQLSKNLKNVRIITNPSEKQKKELFSKAGIFIHPSHFEGFGIVVLEAFANKIPVITSNKGGLPWVVDKAGLIFEDYNLEDLKLKLDSLIKSKKLREDLSKKGYERVKDFTWDKIILDLEEIYKFEITSE